VFGDNAFRHSALILPDCLDARLLRVIVLSGPSSGYRAGQRMRVLTVSSGFVAFVAMRAAQRRAVWDGKRWLRIGCAVQSWTTLDI